MSTLQTILLTLLAFQPTLISAHGAIIAATGNAGGTGMALGINTSTPRDGTRRRPFQQDSTRFRGASAQTFGETLGGGDNQLEAGTEAIMAETGDQLPQITPGGEVTMTLHQVNADGGGPYECMINADGTGNNWQAVAVGTNVPGRRSRNRAGESTDFPLTAEIPANQSCTGTVAGQDNVCLVRCQNSARAGPFGGVVPVQMASGAASAASTGRNTRAVTPRQALAHSAKFAGHKRAVKKDAVDIIEDLNDPDVLAEFLEDENVTKH
ncbi:hypothetical protein QBC38DRAFT_62315 [Podospora fimiseda]|uniref:CAS1 protein n=1 Tax=Podospora fimiseda TaxID=252190 RepID=A0AAN7BUT4_9PEZI|nr:hypothetical protein QBC38DRAFT_62315 [Podospora fimiseda]